MGGGINLQCLFSNPQLADSQDITPSGSQPLVFLSDSVVGDTRCMTYEIVGDEFKEADETLNVTLEQENLDDSISNTRQISITIEDDGDCEWFILCNNSCKTIMIMYKNDTYYVFSRVCLF